jgi:hypothetical protein
MPNARTSIATLCTTLILACGGGDQDPGQITEVARPPEGVTQLRERQQASAPAGRQERQILFGDFHVHTSYSLDAFFTSMPLLSGTGAHPPADACDYARHCAALDFYAITDHARELTPAHWAAEKDSVRQCNAVAGDAANPDLVAFHGFEWTHVGTTPETHWGHKNVIFRGESEAEVPARPISSAGPTNVNPWMDRTPQMRMARFLDPLNWSHYQDLGWLLDEILATPDCDPNVNTRDLPPDCHEFASDPNTLFRKLDEWGFDSTVIPHGSAWGSYTPPLYSWDKHLNTRQHDPKRQQLVEVMSGHGNSEQYRSWREFVREPDGQLSCPEPSEDYLPCCWQGGEIMRERCSELPEDECEALVEETRQLVMRAGNAVDRVLPGTGVEDWLDCGQDRGGFKAAYGLRPRGSVQYALALGRKDESGDPLRFRFGFIGSSDSHTGKASTGYKQSGRLGRTDMVGPRSQFYLDFLSSRGEPEDPLKPEPAGTDVASALTVERLGSFLYPGGTVAVHSESRSRDGIWQALERKEVYGTSGPRILLWFDLVMNDGRRLPMGSEARLVGVPSFEVHAVGSFVQQPGCPDEVVAALGEERVRSLCLDECYRPGDERHPIAAIEVVRIRPQRDENEDVTALIEDPWKRIACEPDTEGCRVEFYDPEFGEQNRDALYYVRALQAPTPALNGANLRTSFGPDGAPEAVSPCRVDAAAAQDDTCLAEVNERAWSSPIYVDQLR